MWVGQPADRIHRLSPTAASHVEWASSLVLVLGSAPSFSISQSSTPDSAHGPLCLLSFYQAGWEPFITCGSNISLFLLKVLRVTPVPSTAEWMCSLCSQNCRGRPGWKRVSPTLDLAGQTQFTLFVRAPWSLPHPTQCLKYSLLLHHWCYPLPHLPRPGTISCSWNLFSYHG